MTIKSFAKPFIIVFTTVNILLNHYLKALAIQIK